MNKLSLIEYDNVLLINDIEETFSYILIEKLD